MATSTPPSPWEDFDAHRAAALNAEQVERGERELRFAFYGRVSTEDLQDSEQSLTRQQAAAERLIAGHGRITVKYGDVGYSRSLAWSQRPDSSLLLAEALSSAHPWDALVAGEGQRAFYGDQFATVAAILVNAGIEVWVPELGGKYDPNNPAHGTLMALTGGMSKGERMRIQQRVTEGMAAQVRTEGRFMGGTAPYGYFVVDTDQPHPNPKEAGRGVKLRRLEVDPETAPVVRRIFEARMRGDSTLQIARDLANDGIVTPGTRLLPRSRRTTEWAKSAVDAILRNQRYTGFEVWG